MTRHIRLDLAPPFADIVLDRPEKRNALSLEMWAALPRMVAEADAAPGVKTIFVHGGENGVFAAGADISEFDEIYADETRAAASIATLEAAMAALNAAKKPILAAIEGPCMGAGVSLALAADLRFAAADALFGLPPAKLGLILPFEDTRRLVAAIGLSAAKDLLFTGRRIGAAEAKALGLVDRAASPGGALAAARAFAAEMADHSQWSIRAIKQVLRLVEAGDPDGRRKGRAIFVEGTQGEDYGEGRRAFLEKRPPRFTFD